MKFLITGGLGFIGSNFICKILKNPKNNVINIDSEFIGSNKLNLVEIEASKNYEYVKGDINDKLIMEKLISKSDVIINFAAESFVDRSINNPKPFIDSNIYGVYNILELIKSFKKKFIQISTDEVFGSLNNSSASEESKFNPSSPYSASKASAELIINSYLKTFDCDCIITRCTNNYGPKQFLEKLIPKTIFLANQNNSIPVYGDGKNIRDWLYVSDHCEAILRVLNDGKTGESYNISSNNELDNLFIIKKILSLMDKSEDLIDFVEDRPGHDFRYSMNSNKIRKELKWNPRISIEDGLKMTIDWYLNNEKYWSFTGEALKNTPWR